MDTTPIPVLIVDDDVTTAALLRELLRNLGPDLECTTTCVTTGAAARAEFKRGEHRLVLLDYLLPDEDGLSLLAAVSVLPEDRRPVVIMLTGAGSEQVAVEAMKLGAKDYMVKTGVNPLALRRAIIGALERHRLEERLAESTAQLRRHNAQLEADLTMAREVQQALLPQQYPLFPPDAAPGASRLNFCHRWLPSHQVAGDFFAVFPVSPGEAGVFQCDVMGHGVRAALITALLRGLLREHQALAGDPGAFLGALNRQLQSMLARVGDLVFVTAVYLVVDTKTGVMKLANAGHPTPLHLERRARRLTPWAMPDGAGPALGLMPEFVYDTVERTMAPGDAVLLFTDGIYEVEDVTAEEFGQARLRGAISTRLGEDTPRLLDGVLAEVQAWRPPGSLGLADDVCLVAVDRPPET
ncbi:MAG TPA: fused response regulator/phosphatase [Lacunisphaera sp.]|nr:fused response regulator/phosphatase [Lacunisphaera sp.]